MSEQTMPLREQSAQPSPELWEIRDEVERRLRERREIATGNPDYRHEINGWPGGYCEAMSEVLALIERALAVPADHLLVPVATIRELDDTLSIYADRFADLEDDNDYYRSGAGFDGHDAIDLRDAAHLVRALLPERGDE